MKFVGAHVSIAGGVENAPLNAAGIGAGAFAMFTANQRRWQVKPLSEKSIAAFKKNLKETGIRPEHVLCHDGYLINLGNPDPRKRQQSLDAFIEEARRVEQLGLTLLNFHPGSHLRLITEEECLTLIADGVREAIAQTEQIVFVLETTAGQGSNMGSTFEQLAAIIDKVAMPGRVGVCIDTCHIFAAGYDIRDDYQGVMAHFAEVIGFHNLRGVHLNDSKATLGQRLDRHHSLGEGYLGLELFRKIMQDPRFDGCPLILETIDPTRWSREIKMLTGFN